MTNLSDIINVLPRMKSGDSLITALEVLPEYNPELWNSDASVRLMALSDLYRVYIPSQMSLEIYSKLYLALLRSMQKKGTKLAVQQQNQNYKAIMQQEYSGIMGGSDSFTIIGTSGIGKSSAIGRAINLITENKVIEADNPYTKVVPCVIVQCPFDSSVKGLLLEVLRKVDEVLDSKYYQNALRARATTDMLIGSVSQVALNHREAVWAARQVEDNRVTLTWRKVRDLTNMRRRDFEACLTYIPDYADGEFAEQILHLL
jgi:hypothetical protein